MSLVSILWNAFLELFIALFLMSFFSYYFVLLFWYSRLESVSPYLARQFVPYARTFMEDFVKGNSDIEDDEDFKEENEEEESEETGGRYDVVCSMLGIKRLFL